MHVKTRTAHVNARGRAGRPLRKEMHVKSRGGGGRGLKAREERNVIILVFFVYSDNNIKEVRF